VTSISKTASTLVFAGSNFDFDATFSPVVSVGEVEASSVVIDSAEQVTATWNLGVPVLSADTTPVFYYENTDGVKHFAQNDQTV